MSDVIQFPSKGPAPDLVYVCACGCKSFEIVFPGNLCCANCKCLVTPEIKGGWTPSANPENIWEGEDPFSLISSNGTDLPRRRLSKQVLDDSNLVFVMLLTSKGRFTAWSALDGEEQNAWLARRLEEAKEIALKGEF